MLIKKVKWKIWKKLPKLSLKQHRLRGNKQVHRNWAQMPTIVSPPPIIRRQSEKVDIIICVHNALQELQDCLKSVLQYTTPPYTLIIVDDGSEEETKNYLQSFARSTGAILLRNDRAKGYTLAANQGIKWSLTHSKADYIVLLNSDTLVTPNWLDRMIACAKSHPRIGLVGPLSNCASWQSIPKVEDNGDWAYNNLPNGISVVDMANIVARYSARLYPRIPFLNGFCLLIKRQVIEEIGLFDEETFGLGYGQENDYCIRARRAGWLLAIADDVYVWHWHSRSYSHAKRLRLTKEADQALIRKWGSKVVSDGVTVCRKNRVLDGIRARSQVMIEREQWISKAKSRWAGKRVLFVLPVAAPGGGANVVFQEAKAMLSMGIDVKIVNLERYRGGFEKAYPAPEVPIIYIPREESLAEICQGFDAVIATANYSVSWLATLDKLRKPPIKGYYVQDFEPYFYAPGTKEYFTAWASYTLFPDLVCFTKTEWNRHEVKEKTGADCTVVGPSVDIDLFRPRPRQDPEYPDRPIRIAAMVRPSSPRRSPKLTMEVLREVSQKYKNNIEIIIFGCDSKDPAFTTLPRDFPFYNAGVLTREQLAFLLNEIDIFVDFSKYQAMGLTAMEAMACGVAVIVPSKGGARSFAKNEKNSLVVDTSAREACVAALERLIVDDDLRLRLQQEAIFDICKFFPEQAAYKILEALFEVR